jgi:hypothetical protein
MSSDMLVKLYDLKPNPELDARLAANGIVIRRALPPEMVTINQWIEPRFGIGWVGENTVAMSRQPPTTFVAIKDKALVGFACYDATARGFFGPTGVDESMRGQGAAGPMDFYARTVGAIAIEGSVPGIYAGMLRAADPNGDDDK